MPLINQIRQFFIYTPSDSLNLLSASFLSSIVAIHRAIPGTTNYLSFRPEAGNLNTFTTLDYNVGYFIDTKPGSSFTIPDAPINNGESSTPITVTGLATISIADLRNLSTAQPSGTGFLVTDKGREGTFLVDTLDTTSPDNNGTVFISSVGQRFRRIFIGPLHTTWFDIRPNDRSAMASNSVKLNTLINNNGVGHILFNGVGSEYFIGVAPENRTFPLSAYCIGLIDFQGTIECDRAVTLITQSLKVGMHIQRTTGISRARLINVSLNHDGGRDSGVDVGVIGYKNLSTGQVVTTKPNDLSNYKRVYGEDWGNYAINGLNAWGVVHSTNLRINGYPGNGLCIFGATTIRFNGPEYPITGTFGYNGGDMYFYPSDEYKDLVFKKLRVGSQSWQLKRSDGRTSSIGGSDEQNYLGIGQVGVGGNTEANGTVASVTVYQAGSSLFADSSVFDGINDISRCGACGVFTTGDEANQNTIKDLRSGDHGGWGVCDSSLLKNSFPDYHSTANGQYFNDFSVNPAYLPVGGFTNRGDSNAGTALGGHQYREGGNMGLDDPSDGTTYGNSGVFPEFIGNNKGFGLINSQIVGIRGTRWIAPDGTHLEAHIENLGNGVYGLKTTII